MYQQLKKHPSALYVLTVTVLVLAVWLTTSSREQRPCLALEAQVYPADLHFLTKEDLLLRMGQYARRPLLGHPTYRLSLHDISVGIAKNPYVKQVNLYRLHSGNIAATVYQKEPLARLSPVKQADVYLTKQGELLGLSQRFTARVPILRLPKGVKASASWNSSASSHRKLFQLLLLFAKDPFWSAQITSIDLRETGGLYLYTQLSKQVIVFGQAENIENKLRRLYILYTHILPQKGWGRYKRVDLRFDNQIVCE